MLENRALDTCEWCHKETSKLFTYVDTNLNSAVLEVCQDCHDRERQYKNNTDKSIN